eukprot:scaffold1809_cov386-Prasinococcus_capsulatus_cf.AAC.12
MAGLLSSTCMFELFDIKSEDILERAGVSMGSRSYVCEATPIDESIEGIIQAIDSFVGANSAGMGTQAEQADQETEFREGNKCPSQRPFNKRCPTKRLWNGEVWMGWVLTIALWSGQAANHGQNVAPAGLLPVFYWRWKKAASERAGALDITPNGKLVNDTAPDLAVHADDMVSDTVLMESGHGATFREARSATPDSLPTKKSEKGRTDSKTVLQSSGDASREGAAYHGTKHSATEMANAVTREVETARAIAEKKAERLGALGLARQLASIHIVLGHLHNKDCEAIADVYLFNWGFTWVPWFFMLSGFVLTHARIASSNPERVDDPLTFMWKRSASIFPVYMLGVILSAALRVIENKTLPAISLLVPERSHSILARVQVRLLKHQKDVDKGHRVRVNHPGIATLVSGRSPSNPAQLLRMVQSVAPQYKQPYVPLVYDPEVQSSLLFSRIRVWNAACQVSIERQGSQLWLPFVRLEGRRFVRLWRVACGLSRTGRPATRKYLGVTAISPYAVARAHSTRYELIFSLCPT